MSFILDQMEWFCCSASLVKNRVRGHYLEKIDNNLKKEKWSVEDVTDKGYMGLQP